MENIVVFVIAALAGVYVARYFLKKTKGDEDCGCGCSSCEAGPTCKDSKPDGPAGG